MNRIDFVNLRNRKDRPYDAALAKFINALQTTSFVGGKYLEEFENNLAKYNGIKYAMGVGSGTDALIISLRALGIGPGDDVIVPTNTFIATAFAVSHIKANIIFVDVDPDTFNISLKNIENKITDRTKAIMPVHLYGCPADIRKIVAFAEANHIFVVEDCAQSIGAEVNGKKTGTFGNTGCFSFYPTKNLGGISQGGAIITEDPEVVSAVRRLANVGRSATDRNAFDFIGYNSRLDTINAIYLDAFLKELPLWTDMRIAIGNMYRKELKDVSEIKMQKIALGNKHVYHLFTIKLPTNQLRNYLKKFLDDRNIGTALYYPIPCHKQSVYPEHNGAKLPVAEELSATTLSLPMHLGLTEENVKYICDSIKDFLS
jgi:dTDP-4-amino-4,6-dideoxygalactose transaminase